MRTGRISGTQLGVGSASYSPCPRSFWEAGSHALNRAVLHFALSTVLPRRCPDVGFNQSAIETGLEPLFSP